MGLTLFEYVLGIPDENFRVKVEEKDIKEFYNVTLQRILGLHSAFVLNEDEMGTQPFADRKAVKVYINKGEQRMHGTLKIGLSRAGRRTTLIGCIALSGDVLTPGTVVPNKTVNVALYDNGYDDSSIKIYNTKNGFISTDIFLAWFRDVVLTYIIKKRNELLQTIGDFNEKAAFIIDGCSCHVNEDLRVICEENNIELIFLVPHSSHMTQILDVGVFGSCKNQLRRYCEYVTQVVKDEDDIENKSTENVFEEQLNMEEVVEKEELDEVEGETITKKVREKRGICLVNRLISMLSAFQAATNRQNVVSAFRQCGITYKTDINCPSKKRDNRCPTKGENCVSGISRNFWVSGCRRGCKQMCFDSNGGAHISSCVRTRT
ncbi:hypothetical protein EIN_512490 [Entamoeba invadens IP1]|uniref:DDE-1 domain-containing protein n=1 Tax=Entamoeba invadens IP1 TaxID=370355 RepID=A0A0A1UFC6_ENTIV|nr:hypothetical protein EIN_512490 [Entamoeba invadens IP1]ELP91516.1 hypothetical protein EIN_512490 [Entamoeba invadens IP1]|eukprot:XP_004258287.1 hypothetical protein EIN_512490 [Entamoeba invadens IP1]